MDQSEIKEIVDEIAERMDVTFGGSGFERVVFEWIVQRVPKGSVMVEIGAGFVSTKCLSAWGELYSIETNTQFMAEYPTRYILCGKGDGYNWDIIAKTLPPKKQQKFILIDGIDRRSILDNLHLFNPDAIYLVHDTNREIEIKLAKDLAKLLGREAVFHTDGDYFATI